VDQKVEAPTDAPDLEIAAALAVKAVQIVVARRIVVARQIVTAVQIAEVLRTVAAPEAARMVGPRMTETGPHAVAEEAWIPTLCSAPLALRRATPGSANCRANGSNPTP
ncbi:MAG: hypothetical protein OSB57_04000, partial [Planctomycetota bacterium]|nr:hypothetical protein [Planctomycetota bacterium]